jgi:hypothetical protein
MLLKPLQQCFPKSSSCTTSNLLHCLLQKCQGLIFVWASNLSRLCWRALSLCSSLNETDQMSDNLAAACGGTVTTDLHAQACNVHLLQGLLLLFAQLRNSSCDKSISSLYVDFSSSL